MSSVTLGRTGLVLEKNGFGALPIQRISSSDAVHLLRKAYEAGFRLFDTARYYTDSEKKLGEAFAGMRDKIIIASKTMALTPEGFRKDLATSLSELGTDYIDIYQFHNPPFCPRPGDGSGLYEEMLKAKEDGKIRHISITSHRYKVAEEAITSGLYSTLQYPFSYLCGEYELRLVSLCQEHNVGFIAMKAMAGGLIRNSKASAAYLEKFSNVLPIWGVQREKELDEFISYIAKPPVLDSELEKVIAEEVERIPNEKARSIAKEYLKELHDGKRDFRF